MYMYLYLYTHTYNTYTNIIVWNSCAVQNTQQRERGRKKDEKKKDTLALNYIFSFTAKLTSPEPRKVSMHPQVWQRKQPSFFFIPNNEHGVTAVSASGMNNTSPVGSIYAVTNWKRYCIRHDSPKSCWIYLHCHRLKKQQCQVRSTEVLLDLFTLSQTEKGTVLTNGFDLSLHPCQFKIYGVKKQLCPRNQNTNFSSCWLNQCRWNYNLWRID